MELDFSDKLSVLQKMILLLRNHPEIRDSYEMIADAWHNRYPTNKASLQTIQRMARMIQYDLGIYPPSPEVKRYRKIARDKIIARKSSFFKRFLALFR